MGCVREHSGFKSGFQQRAAMVMEWQGSFVGWRLWSPRIGFLGRTPLPYARVLGPPRGRRLVK
jgi:hypothetical protein